MHRIKYEYVGTSVIAINFLQEKNVNIYKRFYHVNRIDIHVIDAFWDLRYCKDCFRKSVVMSNLFNKLPVFVISYRYPI